MITSETGIVKTKVFCPHMVRISFIYTKLVHFVQLFSTQILLSASCRDKEILVCAFYKYSVITVFLVFKVVCSVIHLSTSRMILNRIIVNLTGLHS